MKVSLRDRWLLMATVLLACRPADLPDPATDWTRIVQERRLFKPRLSLDRDHGPCRWQPTGRPIASWSCQSLPSIQNVEYRRLATGAATSAASPDATRSPRQIHQVALWRLTLGADFDTVEKELSKTVAADPANADAYSDLSAVHLLKASRGQDPRELARALAAADRALRLDPRHTGASFNRSLALENLSLAGQASDAWSRYLELETAPDWRREATRHQRFLQRPRAEQRWSEQKQVLLRAGEAGKTDSVDAIVDRFRQPAQEMVIFELLGAWAVDREQGRPDEAVRHLRTAEIVARALRRASGERLPLDAVAAVRAAHGKPAVSDRLAGGHRLLDDGYRLYRQSRFLEALEVLARARAALHSADSPLAAVALYYRAFSFYSQQKRQQCLSTLRELAPEVQTHDYLGLEGRLHWLWAMALSADGNTKPGLGHYSLALGVFAAAGERENLALVNARAAESYKQLGAGRAAWASLHAALRGADELGTDRTWVQIADAAANVTRQLQDFSTAFYFQQAAVRHVASLDDPSFHASTLIWRADLHHHFGRRNRARADLDAASDLCQRIADVNRRARCHAEIALVRGLAAGSAKLEDVTAGLTKAIEVYDRHVFGVLTRQARAEAHLTLGNPERAEEDLKQSIELLELRGADLAADGLRLDLAGHLERAFDQMITFQIEVMDDPTRALEYAERQRALSLPALPASARLTGDPATWAQTLPPGLTVVHYAVSSGSLAIWATDREGSEYRAASDGLAARLVDLVRGVRSSTGEPDAWRRQAAQLFDLLVRPWLTGLDEGNAIVLIPDKSLFAVPFSALIDRETGRYLAQDLQLTVAPSAGFLLHAMERLRHDASFGKSTLVVADPAFDRRAYPELDRLPAALGEGHRIREYLADSELMTGVEATRRAFLAAAPDHGYLHVAAHGIADVDHPDRSRLLLTPDAPGASGEVFARDLRELSLARVRLVTLAACETAAGGLLEYEGAMSLVRPFLAAGVPAVVGALWKVDDNEAAELFSRFYRRLDAGESPARALRSAQVEALTTSPAEHGAPPGWAAFQLIGGVE